MIRQYSIILLPLLVFNILSSKGFSQKNDVFAREFVEIWERSAEYTIKVAQLMPEEYYNFRPNEETFTFSQQIAHIITNIYWLNSTFILNEVNPIKDSNLEDLSKEELIKYFEDASKYVLKSAEDLSDKQVSTPIIFAGVIMTKKRIFYLMRDHLTHHRAQSIVYLRLNGIQPPKYVGW